MPITQAAYRQRRSTTEHAFAAKVLTKKTFTSKDHPKCLLLLDMSKTFDTVDKQVLLNV